MLHGEGSGRNALFTGGRDTQLIARLTAALRARGFRVGKHRNPNLQGTSEHNICNQGTTGAGVQLELGRGLRAAMFASLDEAGRRERTPVFDDFVAAVRQTLLSAP